MPVPGLDPAKCAQRNRLSARAGVEAVPVRLLAAAPPPPPDLHYAQGTLPADSDAALAIINTLLPDGAPPLAADDLYIHYVEAASGRYIADRYMFLDGSTLRNMADDARAGIAFMNSHRTGSLSHPTELPYGRTFAGRFEQYRPTADQGPTMHALLGFYMIRGVAPNGTAGPSTDDLHRAVLAGTLFDVSVGFPPGAGLLICDLCGNELESDDCGHAPGTLYNLTRAQITAQLARGVPDGVATYTLVNGHINELSGVYDGAVPGAGFRKTLSLARRRRLSPADLQAAQAAYRTLTTQGDFTMDDVRDAVRNGFTDALAHLGLGSRPAPPAPVLELASAVSELRAPAPDPQLAALAARITALQEAAAQTFVTGLVTAGRLLPADVPGALLDLAEAAADDDARPRAVQFVTADGTVTQGTRLEAVQARLSARAPHTLREPGIPILGMASSPSAPTSPADAGYQDATQWARDNAPKGTSHG